MKYIFSLLIAALPLQVLAQGVVIKKHVISSGGAIRQSRFCADTATINIIGQPMASKYFKVGVFSGYNGYLNEDDTLRLNDCPRDGEPTGVTITEGQPASVNLFPNPNNGSFVLRYSSGSTSEGFIRITDIVGRIIASRNVTMNARDNDFNFDGFLPGIYTIEIYTSNDRRFLKFVVD